MTMASYFFYDYTTASAGTDALVLNGTVGQVSSMHTGPPFTNINKSLFSFRKPFYIGFWNVRTFMDIETQTLTMSTLHEYRIDVACLSEVRLPGSGHSVIKVPQHKAAYHLYHSGPSDGSGLHGVAFALSSAAHSSLMEWEPISQRLARIRLRGPIFNSTIFSVYAPTAVSSAELREEFYSHLEHAMDAVPPGDMLILAGDWNARFGPNDDSSKRAIGNYSIGNRCLNGTRLLEFALTNRCVVSSTRFRHPAHHLITWLSNDGRTKSQIDHMLVRARWASCVLDCRAYRGAETGHQNGSDHYLVRAKLRLRLSAAHPKARNTKINVTRLAIPPLREELEFRLHNRFNAFNSLQSEATSLDTLFSAHSSIIKEEAIKVLGNHIRRTNDWISAETMNLSDQTKRAKAANAPMFPHLRRETAKSARKDRNKFWSETASNMESAAANGNFRQLFELLKKSNKQSYPSNESILDTAGRPITDINQRSERWRSYFQDLLNHPNTTSPQLSLQSDPTYECNVAPPTLAEVEAIINKLKNNKSPGADGIPSEVFKYCSTVLAPWLLNILTQVWINEEVPQSWNEALIIPIYKKGDRKDCSWYQPDRRCCENIRPDPPQSLHEAT